MIAPRPRSVWRALLGAVSGRLRVFSRWTNQTYERREIKLILGLAILIAIVLHIEAVPAPIFVLILALATLGFLIVNRR